jgi:predicted kinase
VVADSVNASGMTREAWRAVAATAGASAVEVEVVCSDTAEHRRRVEQRRSDIAGLKLPSWAEVEAREYHPWLRERIVIDTAGRSLDACLEDLNTALAGL